MLTSTGPHLLRFLLSLLVRLRLSIGHVALALRARFASFWRSVLTSARRGDQPQIRLRANNDPTVDSNPPGRTKEEEAGGTLAALPVWPVVHWEDELSRYQSRTSNHQFDIFDLVPATPEGGSRRYKPGPVSQSIEQLEIPPGQRTLLSAVQRLPDGWRQYIHPEGNVFFYHERLRIFTESDIIQSEKREEVFYCAMTLVRQAIEKDAILDEFTEVVLNVDDNRRCHYYFVDHKHRLLFWVKPVRAREDLGADLQRITGYSHIRYLVENQYWYIAYDMESRSHCEYYPHNRILPKGVFEDLRGMLNYAKTDMMTTDSSPSPFAQDELVAILDLVNSLKDVGTISDPYSIWIIARLMAFFTENQFLNFCGQSCARLNADTPLFGQQTWNRRVIFQIINVLLFGSPNEHANRLQRIWVDGIIIQPRWKDFVNRLTDELGRYTIFSTVMLAVNFSFLAVPGVVSAGTPANKIQIIIYCSVILTIASIVFSFALLNVYSDPGLMTAGTPAEAMRTLSQTRAGMARLAITHSLPIACLVWSMVLFSVALAIQIFDPNELASRATLGVECGILVLLGIMSTGVMWLFSRNQEVDDVDASGEENPPPTGSQHDVEQGPGS